MKAISLWQPWAMLVVIGAKRVETRARRTSVRGRIAIHATNDSPLWARELIKRPPFTEPLAAAGIHQWNDLPRGAIIGCVDLVDDVEIPGLPLQIIIKPAANSPGLDLVRDGQTARPLPIHTLTIPPGEPEFSFGDYRAGRRAWILARPERLKIPYPCKGSQAWFEVPEPIQ